MSTRRFGLLFVCAGIIGRLGFAQSTGSISGSVIDASGPVKGNVWVTAIRTALPPARATAAAGSNGAFLLSNLPAGTYRICVQALGERYLDPCQWSGSGPQAAKEVTVRAGQVSSGVEVLLEAASRLQIHLKDPSDLLDDRHPEREVVVGVFTPEGLFYPAAVRSKAGKTRVHEIFVPFDRPVKVHVAGGKLKVEDDRGAAVDAAGKTVSVTAAKGTADPAPVVYTVTGVRP